MFTNVLTQRKTKSDSWFVLFMNLCLIAMWTMHDDCVSHKIHRCKFVEVLIVLMWIMYFDWRKKSLLNRSVCYSVWTLWIHCVSPAMYWTKLNSYTLNSCSIFTRNWVSVTFICVNKSKKKKLPNNRRYSVLLSCLFFLPLFSLLNLFRCGFVFVFIYFILFTLRSVFLLTISLETELCHFFSISVFFLLFHCFMSIFALFSSLCPFIRYASPTFLHIFHSLQIEWRLNFFGRELSEMVSETASETASETTSETALFRFYPPSPSIFYFFFFYFTLSHLLSLVRSSSHYLPHIYSLSHSLVLYLCKLCYHGTIIKTFETHFELFFVVRNEIDNTITRFFNWFWKLNENQNRFTPTWLNWKWYFWIEYCAF